MNTANGIDHRRLTKGIAIAGIIGILLGIWQISSHIRSPFIPKTASSAESAASNETLQALQSRDTDEDGINDFAELYTYNTSPYLADSDSDGDTDSAEINAGSDPNCPKGEDCIGAATTTNTNAQANSNGASLASIDPALLREILKNAGAPQSVLDQTSDAELLQLYQETVGETSTNGSTTNSSLASIENLTPAEVRQLLIENGASKEELDTIDDETLMTVFNEALQEQQNSP